ncbi:hypothetical protein ACHAWF_002157, partial [Thalassiosira exigua]
DSTEVLFPALALIRGVGLPALALIRGVSLPAQALIRGVVRQRVTFKTEIVCLFQRCLTPHETARLVVEPALVGPDKNGLSPVEDEVVAIVGYALD